MDAGTRSYLKNWSVIAAEILEPLRGRTVLLSRLTSLIEDHAHARIRRALHGVAYPSPVHRVLVGLVVHGELRWTGSEIHIPSASSSAVGEE